MTKTKWVNIIKIIYIKLLTFEGVSFQISTTQYFVFEHNYDSRLSDLCYFNYYLQKLTNIGLGVAHILYVTHKGGRTWWEFGIFIAVGPYDQKIFPRGV